MGKITGKAIQSIKINANKYSAYTSYTYICSHKLIKINIMQAFITINNDNTTIFNQILIKLNIFQRTKIVQNGSSETVLFKIHQATEEEVQELSTIADILNNPFTFL